jgi:hypothetical protein
MTINFENPYRSETKRSEIELNELGDQCMRMKTSPASVFASMKK